jgi:hypothetical protein
MDDSTKQLSWRPNEWLALTGRPFTRVKLYQEIRAGKIAAKKAGKNLLILTPPAAYLESLPSTLGHPFGRGRKRKVAA